MLDTHTRIPQPYPSCRPFERRNPNRLPRKIEISLKIGALTARLPPENTRKPPFFQFAPSFFPFFSPHVLPRILIFFFFFIRRLFAAFFFPPPFSAFCRRLVCSTYVLRTNAHIMYQVYIYQPEKAEAKIKQTGKKNNQFWPWITNKSQP